MTAPPTRTGSPPPFHHAVLMRAESPPVEFYEYLEKSLPRNLVRSAWADLARNELGLLLADSAIELYVAYEGGVPSGFVGLDLRDENEPDIAALAVKSELPSVAPERYLLEWAIERLWQLEPSLISTNVVRADHFEALAILQRAGFEPFDGDPQ